MFFLRTDRVQKQVASYFCARLNDYFCFCFMEKRKFMIPTCPGKNDDYHHEWYTKLTPKNCYKYGYHCVLVRVLSLERVLQVLMTLLLYFSRTGYRAAEMNIKYLLCWEVYSMSSLPA